MSYKDHLPTQEENRRRIQKQNRAIQATNFVASPPALTTSLSDIGVEVQPPSSVQDHLNPLLEDIADFSDNVATTVTVELDKIAAGLQRIQLPDVGAIAINFVNLVKNKAERFFLDLTKENVLNTPTVTFTPPIAGLSQTDIDANDRICVLIEARDTEDEVRFDAVGGTTGGSFAQTPWLQDIDADGWHLQDLGSVEFRNNLATPAAAVALYSDGIELFTKSNINYNGNDITGLDDIIFNLANQSITSDSLGIQILADTGDSVTLGTNGIARFFVTDTFAELVNAGMKINGNALFLDADDDTKIQVGTDDVLQITIGGLTPAIMMSMSQASTVFANEIIAAGAGEGMTNIGHLDFIDNLASPASALSIFSDGTDIFANTGGMTVNLSDIASNVQTPWLQDIDADGWHLQDLGSVEFRNNLATPAAAVALYSDGVELFTKSNINMNSQDITGLDDIIFALAGQSITSDAAGIQIIAAAGDSVTLATNGIARIFASDTDVEIINADFKMNGNALFLDADDDTKWQAGTDDVAQLTIGGAVPAVMLSISQASSTFTNNVLIGGNLDMLSDEIIGVTYLESDAAAVPTSGFIRMGNGESITWDSSPTGTALTLSANVTEDLVVGANWNSLLLSAGVDIQAGGAGVGMSNIGHLDFINNLATPGATVALYSDGVELFTKSNINFNSQDITGLDDIIFAIANQSITSDGAGISILADTGDSVVLGTNGITRLFAVDAGVEIINGDLKMNGNALWFDADDDTKIQAGTDDVMQFTIGGAVPAVMLSISQASLVTGAAPLILGGNLDVNGNNIVMGNGDITGLNAISFTDAGGQIAGSAVSPHMNFVVTGTFRFTASAENILDIDTNGLTILGTNNIALGNNNITGVNQIAFNEANQTITDSTTGIDISVPDTLDHIDLIVNGQQTRIADGFVDVSTNSIDFTERVSAPAAGTNQAKIYAKDDATVTKLYVKWSDNTEIEIGSGGGASPLTTKGDIWGYDTADNRVPVGVNNQVLMADSVQALGIKYASITNANLATGDFDAITGIGTQAQNLVMGNNDITGINAIGFTDAGGQIAGAAVAPHMNFVLTGVSTFRFTTNAENILDITDAGLTMLGTNNIALGNNNITGVNQIAFNEASQTITDDINGMRFSLPDATDTFDFTINAVTALSIEKFFVDFAETAIQMNDRAADPASPAAGDVYFYAKLDGGISKLFYKQSDATVVGPLGAGAGIVDPIEQKVNTISSGAGAKTIDASTANVHKTTLTADISISSITDALGAGSPYELIHFIVIQDATGGWDITSWPASVNGTPTIDPAALARTDIILYTEDQGTNWYFTLATAGSGGSQTPWAQDVVAAGFDLNDLSNLEFRSTAGAPAAGVRSIYYNDATGMVFNSLTGDDLRFRVNGATKVGVNSTGLVFLNNVTAPVASVATISKDAGGLIFNVDTPDDYTFLTGAASAITMNASLLDLNGNYTIQWNGTADRRIFNSTTGFIFESLASTTFDFQMAGVSKMLLSTTGLDMQGLDITDLDDITFTAGHSITSNADDVTINVESVTPPSTLFLAMDGVAQYSFTDTDFDLKGNNLLFDASFNLKINSGTPDVLELTIGAGEKFLIQEAATVFATFDGAANQTTFARPVEFEGNIGFYNTTPISKPTVTGSRGGNAALASLLTQLANLGLIVDSTT